MSCTFTLRAIPIVFAALAGMALPAFAGDTAASFSFTAVIPGETASAVSGDGAGVIRFPSAALGEAVTVNLIVRSAAASAYSITGAALTDPAFQLRADGAAVPAGGFAILPLTFMPQRRGLSSGFLGFTLSAGAARFNYLFSVSGMGIAPELVFSYIAPPELNQLAVTDGASLALPPSVVTAPVTTTFVLANNGSSPAAVTGVSLQGGEVFSLTGTPLLPRTLPPGGDLRFGVQFKPLAVQTYDGLLTVSTSAGGYRVRLRANGVASSLSYEVLTGPAPGPLEPGGTIQLPELAPGSPPASVRLRVSNRGGADSIVNQVTMTAGQGNEISLANLPILPAAVLPGRQFEFDVVFNPAAVGSRSATLRIGEQTFVVAGAGLGANPVLFIDRGLGEERLETSAAIAFANTEVGGARDATLIIRNLGNRPGSIASIGITGNATVYSVSALPALPLSLEPGAQTSLTIRFAPLELGATSAAITIDGRPVTLTGTGMPPPPLPPLKIGGVAGPLNYLDQPPLQVTLDETYPYDIAGQLTVDFSPEFFVDDPAVRFPTGRSVDFAIPAGSKEAVFGIWGNQIPFQTGTSAGRLRFRAMASVGRVNMTGENPPTESTTLPVTAPEVRTLRAAVDRNEGRNPALLSVVVSGYSPTRSLRRLRLELLPAEGASIGNPQIDLDVEAAFTTWFGSSESIASGTQFSVTVALQLNGDPKAIRGIAARAVNSVGESAARTVDLNP